MWNPIGHNGDGQTAQIDGYIDSSTANVEYADGHSGTLVSTVPLRSDIGDGKTAPVDFSIARDGDQLEPVNPLVDTTVPDQADETLRFPEEHYSLGLSDATDAGAHVSDGRAFYANVLPDTDELIQAMPAGAELSWILRADDSPRDIALNLHLGDGQDTQLAAPSMGQQPSVQITDGGTAVAGLHPAVALDANGEQIPTHYELEGSTVHLVVDDSGGGYALPYYVDPYFENYQVDQNWNHTGTGDAFAGWNYATNFGWFAYQTNGSYGTGLYIATMANSYYPDNAQGVYKWTAPAGAEIERVNFGTARNVPNNTCMIRGMSHPSSSGDVYEQDRMYDGYSETDTGGGIRNFCSAFDGQQVEANVGRSSVPDGPGGDPEGTPGNSAVFGMVANGTGTRAAVAGVYLYGASIWLYDPSPPEFNNFTRPATAEKWIDDRDANGNPKTFTQAFNIDDNTTNVNGRMVAGLGAWGVDVSVVQNWQTSWGRIWNSCPTGTNPDSSYRIKCATPFTGSMPYSFLWDGWNTVSLTAFDVGNDSVNPDQKRVVSWHQGIDRTAPTITLPDAMQALGNTPDTSGEDLFGGDIVATDGTAGGLPSLRQSGVKDLSVYVAGNLEATGASDTSCVDSCSVDIPDFEFAYDRYTPGSSVDFKVVANDRVGHQAVIDKLVKIPVSSDYAALLSNWKSSVESSVDGANPAPLSGPMPAVPMDWQTPGSCEATASADGSCFDRANAWLSAVKNWLSQNSLLATDYSKLPAMPTYGWAPSATASQLTYSMADGFHAITQSSSLSDLNQLLRVALTFHSPQTPSQVQSIFNPASILSNVEFRGVFEPSGISAITGGSTQTQAETISAHLSDFYSRQLAFAQQEQTDLQDEAANPSGDPSGTSLTSDDLSAASSYSTQIGREINALGSNAPFVTGVVASLSASQVLGLVASPPPALKTMAIADTLDADTSAGLLDQVLESSATDAETAAWTSRDQGPDTPQVSRQTAPAANAQSGASPVAGATCATDGQPDVTKNNIAESFEPNAMEAKIAFNGPVQNDGRHNKITSLHMRWARPGALAWFCGAPKAKRAFEPESKPEVNGTVHGSYAEARWSSNWTDGDWTSNLPKAYKDDIACGTGCDSTLNRFKASTYPDFSIGSGNARALVYGQLYSSRFETNSGDIDYGNAFIRGQQNEHAAIPSKEKDYCNIRSAAAGHFYLDRYCFFGRGTYKYMTIPLRTAHYIHRSYNWIPDDRPFDLNNIGAVGGSGAP